MSSQLEIYNMAAARVGTSLMDSATENTAVANFLNKIFEGHKKKLLGDHPFIGAKRTDTLSLAAGPPTHQRYSNGFALPADFLTAWRINEESDGSNLPLWELETQGTTRILWTDAETCDLELSFNLLAADLNNLGEETAFALAMKLAIALAPSFGRKEVDMQSVRNDYVDALNDAKSVNSMQGKKKYTRSTPLLNARLAHGSGLAPWDMGNPV